MQRSAEPRRAADPIVIAHRGASGHRPEHTLAAYQLAIDMGADYIEPDVVFTSDGELVVRHENEISRTTDVAQRPEFAGRRTTKAIDGSPVRGWFTEDFTLAELATLGTRERFPELRPHNAALDGRYGIPTLEDVLALARANDAGIYVEMKHPAHFASIGFPIEARLVEVLHGNGFGGPDAKAFIQSFEVGSLRTVREMTGLPLVQLIGGNGAPYDLVAAGDDVSYDDLTSPRWLRRIATYADGIGPSKTRIVPTDAEGNLAEPTRLVGDAHEAGLVVHPYTFRNENAFLPADFRLGDPTAEQFLAGEGDAAAEYRLYFELGVDGLFSDHPDTAVGARRAWLRDRSASRERRGSASR